MDIKVDLVKHNIEKEIDKFNNEFKRVGFHSRLSLNVFPFWQLSDLIPAPDHFDQERQEILHKYNEFIALNGHIRNNFFVIKNRIPSPNKNKLFVSKKINEKNLSNNFNITFQIETDEIYLANAMEFILKEKDHLVCPMEYFVDKKLCTFFFSNEIDVMKWKGYFNDLEYWKKAYDDPEDI